jgi:hypothetical protein
MQVMNTNYNICLFTCPIPSKISFTLLISKYLKIFLKSADS